MTRIQRTAADPRSNLGELMNVGKAVVGYFERAGITRTDQLAGRDPLEIYDAMCEVDARRHDPCLLDTIMSAVDQANGNPGRPWWTYTSHRKQLLANTIPTREEPGTHQRAPSEAPDRKPDGMGAVGASRPP